MFVICYLTLGLAMYLFQDFIWPLSALLLILIWVDYVQDSNDNRR